VDTPAKVAGTERGVTEPERRNILQACFGSSIYAL